MSESKKSKGVLVLIIILVLLLVATSGYIVYDKFFIKEDVEDKEKSDKEGKREDKKVQLSLTDASFLNIYNAVSKFTYEQNRESGWSSFVPNEMINIIAKDLNNSDFSYVGKKMIEGWNREVYHLSYQTLIDKLKQYFSSDITFDANAVINSNGVTILPNVTFNEGSGMVISSYDNTTGMYEVYFGGVGGTSSPMPQITNRKITDAYRLGDKIYVTEKAIYYTSSYSSDGSRAFYSVYSHPGNTNLLDNFEFSIEDIMSQTISVDSYLDKAATISYIFTKDSNSDHYVFTSSKIS